MEKPKKHTGMITMILHNKGYGFVVSDKDDSSHFFHRSGCITDFGDLREGHEVEFMVVDIPQGTKGTKAIGVTKIDNIPKLDVVIC